jgi:predicted KAP-like P-loop ATPase
VTKHRKRGTPWPLESLARVGGGRVPTLSDEPIHSPEEVRLGRAAYAPLLARALIEYPETSSLVVTPYGDWGSGKTSTLILCFQTFRDLRPKGEPLGIRRELWWLSSMGDLL